MPCCHRPLLGVKHCEVFTPPLPEAVGSMPTAASLFLPSALTPVGGRACQWVVHAVYLGSLYGTSSSTLTFEDISFKCFLPEKGFLFNVRFVPLSARVTGKTLFETTGSIFFLFVVKRYKQFGLLGICFCLSLKCRIHL